MTRILEESHWPKRQITSIIEITNIWDDESICAKAQLECGHNIIITGPAAINRDFVHCKMCNNEVKN